MESKNVEQSNNFFEILPLVNFILSLLIVMHHSFNINVDYNVELKTISWACERLFYNISECAVPIFFFISAMLFFRNYQGTRAEYATKVKKRFFSIVVPYLLFNVFGYFKHLLFSGNRFDMYGFIKSIILSDTMPLWFLRELFILVLLAPAIFYLRKHLKLNMIIIFLIWLLVILGVIRYRCFLYWLPFYLFGSFIGMKELQNVAMCLKKRNIQYLVFSIVPIFAWFLPNSTYPMKYSGNLFFYCFRYYSILVGILAMGLLLQKAHKVYWFMKYSFWVYCVHFPIITFVNVFFNKVPLLQDSLKIVLYFLTVILVYCLAVFLGWIIQRIVPRIWKILNGKR